MQFDQLRRRALIALLGGVAPFFLSPGIARAQQPKRVGVLMNNVATDANARNYIAAFTQQLRKLGWIDGQNLHIEYRWRGDDIALARTYAGELVALAPDVILSASTANLTVLQRLSPASPIVFTEVSDPVSQGFVLNMARPGGNITGFTAYEFTIGGKWIDLLKQMVPTITHVAVMFNPATSPQTKFFMSSIEAAAPRFGVTVTATPVHEPAEIEPAIANLSRRPNSGMIISTDSFMIVHRTHIIEAAARYRMPAIYPNIEFARDGGLMRYGPEYDDQYRQAGVYVDRILRGTKAGDLPVQTPIKYSLVINLKTARSLEIEVPLSLLLIADEQIE
jgi:putative ABC transport system substrate-binding protein